MFLADLPTGRVGRPAVIEKYNHPASSFVHNSTIPKLPLPQTSIAPGFSPGIRENITHYIIPLHA
ncbi:MAG: hypothetical protein JXA72_13480, partial [Bacteroidales bacterium]|nr:hypothetical protein [Bacteroidales bacterium]